MSSMFGERVRILRLANSMSQADLTRAISGGSVESNSLVSRIENGQHVPDAATVDALCAALGCKPEFFELRKPLPLATRPWLRAFADASARAVEYVIADNTLAEEVVQELALRRMPDLIPTFEGDPNDDVAVEQYAADVRSAASVAEGERVGNAMRAADRLGCVVLPLPGELGRHLGLSQRLDGRPYIRVSRPGFGDVGVPGDRQRFTVCHEIGHLGLHADQPPPKTAEDARRIEQQAHRFAGAFLTPADPILEHWHQLGGRATLSILAELKSHWGISIKALVVRFQQLNVISADQATSLYKQISKRGWTKHEPVEATTEEPLWLSRALEQHERGGAAAVANKAFLAERHVRRWTDWTALNAPAEVVELRARPNSSTGREDLLRPAEVLDLNARR